MKHKIKAHTAVELLHIFWPNFVEVNDLVLLPWGSAITLSDAQRELDHTGVEAFLNHTHVMDIFRHEVAWEDEHYNHNHPDFASLCEIGKKLAHMWS
jgi:hypothetical protein